MGGGLSPLLLQKRVRSDKANSITTVIDPRFSLRIPGLRLGSKPITLKNEMKKNFAWHNEAKEGKARQERSARVVGKRPRDERKTH
jgi:hypothetical protein